MSARVVAFANVKGGCAKTLSSTSTAAAFAERGLKVCVIDLDPQHGVSTVLGIAVDPNRTIGEAILGQVTLAEIAVETPWGFSVIPATRNLNLAAAMLTGNRMIQWQTVLRELIEEAGDTFEIVILDTPPGGDGTLISLGINAADDLVIVAVPDLAPMEHAKETLDLAGLAKGPRGFNRDLNVVGCLRTMAQPLTKAYRNSTALAEALGVPILPIEIPYSTTARDAALDLQPILTYAPTNAVSTAYRALAGFLLGESVEATEIVEAVA